MLLEQKTKGKEKENKNPQTTTTNQPKLTKIPNQQNSSTSVTLMGNSISFNHWLFTHANTSVFIFLCWRPMFFMSNILLLLFSPLTNYAETNIFQKTLVKKITLKSGLDNNHLLGQTKIKKITCMQKPQLVIKVILNKSLQSYSKSLFLAHVGGKWSIKEGENNSMIAASQHLLP